MANLPPASLYSQDLRGRRIRILDLSSVLPGEQEPIQGDLRVVSLDRGYWIPTYEALSYVWGEDSDSPSRHLSCSGVKIPITRNCYDALRTLHRHFGVRSIWVDAICINQDNVEEKEHQIPLMREIFGSARRVFIWLGNGTRESDEAFTWIARESAFDSVLGVAMLKPFPAIMLPSEILKAVRLIPLWIEKRCWRIVRYLKLRAHRQYDGDAMQDIVERPWFGRMWTLQELVMASEPHIVCGTKRLRWHDLNWGLCKWMERPENRSDKAGIETLILVLTAHTFWITRYVKAIDVEGDSRTWIQGNGMAARAWQWLLNRLESRKRLLRILQDGLMAAIIIVRFILGLRPLDSKFLLLVLITRIIAVIITPRQPVPPPGTRPFWEDLLRHKLPDIMNWSRRRDAKQPVDKVFALHGLFQDFGIPLQRPDYSKPMGQVYLEFTCALIQWHECLRILAEAAAPGIPGIPTWVPDWSRRYSRISVGNGHASGDSVASFTIVSGAYDSSGLSGHNREEFEWTPDVTRSNPSDMPKIITNGFVEDKIAFCFPPLQEDTEKRTFQSEKKEEPSPALLHNTAVMLHWAAISQNPHFSKDAPPASKSEKLFEIMHCGVWNYFSGRDHLKTLFPDWLSLLNSHINPLSNTETPDPSTVKSCARALQENERLYSYHVERCNALADRRSIFFTTEKNRLGRGPECLKDGDVVALLAGNGDPMVLRGDMGAYRVVGVAVLEGVMDGESWRDHGEVGELVLV